MQKLSKPLFLALTLIVLVIAVPALEVLRFGGAVRAVESRFHGNSQGIGLPGSSENVLIDRERGVAYLSLTLPDKEVLVCKPS